MSLKSIHSILFIAASCAVLLLAGGCADVPVRKPLPVELTDKAFIPGIPDARFWGDAWPKYSAEIFNSFTDEEMQQHFSGVYAKPHNYLAISGGGANGAFGAGLFAGWTANGTRPEFTMVTGISTGALTAPFVFLGTDYDPVLKKLYTTITTEDIVVKRSVLAAAFGDSMADTAPLKNLIAEYITDDIVQAIATEHARGRRLYVGTLNLDAARPVIWNIGAIAASDSPGKIDLIHEVMRASAAIPVAFPPAVIEVEADGGLYDEMHVDGGTGTQVFVYPAEVNWPQITKKLKVKGKPQVYVIRNSFLEPDYNGVKQTVFPIASRSINSLIRTQGIGDVYQIFALCHRDGNEFNLAYIPAEFTEKPTEGFDKVYMGKLYQFGYDMGREGYPWKKGPPGFRRE